MRIEELYKIFQESGHVCIDTRQIIGGEIFLCLKGERFNGNQFADQALQKGASYVVVDDKEYLKQDHEQYIYVDDSLETLQKLAAHHREQLKIPFVGITGSNGKTTTKELVAAVLSKQFQVFSTPGNFNNHIGVPLSLLQITENHQIAIIEMGANHVGEIAELCAISKPTHGIITNIGRAHLEGFGSIENIQTTKLGLYDAVKSINGHLFVHESDHFLMEESESFERTTYGLSNFADISVKPIKNGMALQFSYQNLEINTQLFGEFNIYNAAAALAVGNYFEVPIEKMKDALESYHPANNRSQIEKGPNNELILDAYNANPDSMQKAIDFFNKIDSSGKYIILGDMLEMGVYEKKVHRQILENVRVSRFKSVFLVGPAFSQLKEEYPAFRFFQTVEDAIEFFKIHPLKNAQIMLKGSRGIRLEALKEILL